MFYVCQLTKLFPTPVQRKSPRTTNRCKPHVNVAPPGLQLLLSFRSYSGLLCKQTISKRWNIQNYRGYCTQSLKFLPHILGNIP